MAADDVIWQTKTDPIHLKGKQSTTFEIATREKSLKLKYKYYYHVTEELELVKIHRRRRR